MLVLHLKVAHLDYTRRIEFWMKWNTDLGTLHELGLYKLVQSSFSHCAAGQRLITGGIVKGDMRAGTGATRAIALVRAAKPWYLAFGATITTGGRSCGNVWTLPAVGVTPEIKGVIKKKRQAQGAVRRTNRMVCTSPHWPEERGVEQR